MNLHNAKYILTIVREGSISAASHKLFISQSALSQTIKQVEANLGTTIFDRKGGKLNLTYAGEVYINTARQMIMLENNLKSELQELHEENCGLLRFGISAHYGMTVLPAALKEFIIKYPHVKIHVEEAGSSTQVKLLKEGVIDIALARTVQRKAGLVYQLLQEECIGLLASQGSNLFHKYPNGTKIDLTDAVEDSFVFLKEGHSARSTQDRIAALYGLSLKKLIELDSSEIAKRVTLSCGCVMVIPRSLVSHKSSYPDSFHFYPLHQIPSEQHTYIIYRENLYLTQYMRDWIALITNQMEEIIKN